MGLIGTKDNTIRLISFTDLVQVSRCMSMMTEDEAKALHKACPLPDALCRGNYPWIDARGLLKETIKQAFQEASERWSRENEDASRWLAQALIKFAKRDARTWKYEGLGARLKMISPGGWWPLDRDDLIQVLEINKSISNSIETIFIGNVYREMDSRWPGIRRHLADIRLGEHKGDSPNMGFTGQTRWEMDGSEKFMYSSNLVVRANIRGVEFPGDFLYKDVREMSVATLFIDVIDELNWIQQWDS